MDIQLALMCGIDIPIVDLQLVFHQPSIKEIAYIGEEAFFKGIQMVTINKTTIFQDNSLLESTTNFQIFMTLIHEKTEESKKDIIISLFQLIFPTYSVAFSPQSLIINKGQEGITIIDESNFELFQEWFRKIFDFASGDKQQSFNPADKKAEEIAKKIMRGRQIAAKQKGENNSNIFSRYLSVLTIGLNAMPLSEAMKLTMFQLFDLIERYSLHLSWGLDIRTRLAGGSPDSKPDDWMKNIH